MENKYPLVFTTPFPPSVNNYYSKARNGIFINANGRKFRDKSRDMIIEQFNPWCIEDKLRMQVILYSPDKRIRDLDNHMKGLQDTLSKDKKGGWGGVYLDDKQIDQLEVYRGRVISKNGKAVIILTEALPIIPVGCEYLIMDE